MTRRLAGAVILNIRYASDNGEKYHGKPRQTKFVYRYVTGALAYKHSAAKCPVN